MYESICHCHSLLLGLVGPSNPIQSIPPLHSNLALLLPSLLLSQSVCLVLGAWCYASSPALPPPLPPPLPTSGFSSWLSTTLHSTPLSMYSAQRTNVNVAGLPLRSGCVLRGQVSLFCQVYLLARAGQSQSHAGHFRIEACLLLHFGNLLFFFFFFQNIFRTSLDHISNSSSFLFYLPFLPSLDF